ncbi:MAG: efflux RND transporter periplasmic adaptor subunit [Verrucomicrobiota bacterium]
MKRLPLVLLTATLAATGGWFAARNTPPAHGHADAINPTGERKIRLYQSPMHPWITSDQPGKCTICGMDLAPVYEGDAGYGASGDLVTLPAATATVIGVETAEARRAPLTRSLRVTGTLEDDETRHRVLSAQTPGRIEKLHVDQVGATVKAGQPLATLYSPDVYAAQRLYIERHVAGPDAVTASELSAALENLLALGLVEADIRRIEKTRRPESTVEIRAPFDGVVISRTAYAGAYVKETDPLFEVGDFAHLWFIFDAYEADLPFLHVGQTVDIATPSLPGEILTAPIAFIDPNIDPTTRTARVRVVLDNADGRLRHRQTAAARVAITTDDTLLVPRSAVLFTRHDPLVYLARSETQYAPRPVRLGRAGDDDYEVLAGLQPGDRVVTRAALLIDSQAQIANPSAPTAKSNPSGYSLNPDTDNKELTKPIISKKLVLAAADAAYALAADDLAGYAKRLPALTADGQPPALAPLAAKLVAGPDLKTARAAFEPWSTALADLVLAQPATERDVSVFQCPMTPVLGTGRWVSRTADLKNPFFGSEMLECGEELK